ncbi:MAG TPA: SCP2 sterol-binding domain-containing protein [Microvirga sp.]|nr:SCP2 sterol-binding domain-containing protein [Microvirga sp.]
MMPSSPSATALPAFVSAVLRPLPLEPLQLFLSAVMRRIVRRHPSLFERLGSYAGKRYGLLPSDLPFSFVLDTALHAPRIHVVRSLPGRLDARISGPLRALVGMADGSYDGDALFFSRTIVVEGDIEAVLALRNAVDDAGIDVLHEGAAMLGPLGHFGEALLHHRRSQSLDRRSGGLHSRSRETSSWS